MANETSKAHDRRARDPLFQEVFRGKACDIGGGNDPLKQTPQFQELNVDLVVDYGGKHPKLVKRDAEQVGEYDLLRKGEYDLVYSSQCLEHLGSPHRAVYNWWKLVKIGGHLVITVPDFVLYENGVWPHLFNSQHVTAWREDTRSPDPEKSPGCIPLRELLESLPGAKILKCAIEDTGYDYDLLARVQNGDTAPVDQTMPPYNAEAFIEAVVRKLK